MAFQLHVNEIVHDVVLCAGCLLNIMPVRFTQVIVYSHMLFICISGRYLVM